MDLSRTHDRVGALWLPKGPQQPEPVRPEDHSLDDFDIIGYRDELRRLYDAASAQCDNPRLTGDQRQYAAGTKRGLRDALKLMDANRRPPDAPVGDNANGDRGGHHEGAAQEASATTSTPTSE